MLQLVGFLQVRLSEPCNKGGVERCPPLLRLPWKRWRALRAEDRITSTQLYNVAYRELLTSAFSCRPSKQASRFPVAVVAALEELVQDTESHQLLQSIWLVAPPAELGHTQVSVTTAASYRQVSS